MRLDHNNDIHSKETCTEIHTKEACTGAAGAIRDTLYVLGGKWKLPILMTLASGPRRFRELQKALEDITPKVLSKELKDQIGRAHV